MRAEYHVVTFVGSRHALWMVTVRRSKTVTLISACWNLFARGLMAANQHGWYLSAMYTCMYISHRCMLIVCLLIFTWKVDKEKFNVSSQSGNELAAVKAVLDVR